MTAESDFSKTFREQYKRLTRLAFFWGASLEQADELVQESFKVLWEKTLNGEKPTSDIAFLLTVTKNKTMNLLKRRNIEQRLFEEFDEQDFGQDDNLGGFRMRDRCVVEKVHLFERQFPEAGYAIRLQLDGFEITRIAEVIQRTPEATKQYLYQVRRKLQPYLAECVQYD
jgi:DNA-directed RNA polymerase specialized sigma24 family protein